MASNDHLGPGAALVLSCLHRQADEPPDVNSLAYWKTRAFRAEARVKQLERQSSNDSWALSNYREDARRRRDAEIGEMGGGG